MNEKEEGLRAIRGLVNAFIISILFWLLIGYVYMVVTR